MKTNAAASYVASNATAATLATALETSGANGKPLWQSYVLGVAPSDTAAFTPVSAPVDADTGNITLAFPSIDTSKYSNDFTVKYKVGSTEFSDPAAVKVPLGDSGNFDVKIKLD